MSKPLEVEIIEPGSYPARVSEIEVKGLVRVEEIRLERTKIRSIAAIVIASIFGLVGTCHAICGSG